MVSGAAGARARADGAVLRGPEDFPPRPLPPDAQLELLVRTGVVEVRAQPTYVTIGGALSASPPVVIPRESPAIPKLGRFVSLEPLTED